MRTVCLDVESGIGGVAVVDAAVRLEQSEDDLAFCRLCRRIGGNGLRGTAEGRGLHHEGLSQSFQVVACKLNGAEHIVA